MCTMLNGAAAESASFEMREIDSAIRIGYGVAVADIDGDKRADIILADQHQIVWYRNPSWSKHLMAENLTREDNVCVAAADLDGDGKAEVAAGAGWNPGDTQNSGALFLLEPPDDRTSVWKPRALPHEPTLHRMRWHKIGWREYGLAVLPLHGRGNTEGTGAGVKFLSYRRTGGLSGAWREELINGSWHVTHNFDLVKWTRQPGDEFLVAAREGVFHLVPNGEGWAKDELAGERVGTPGFKGASEVRGGWTSGERFVVTIEPFHGTQVVLYTPPPGVQDRGWRREVIDDSVREGHALATGELLQTGSDQIVMGWRIKNEEGITGIRLYQRDNNGTWSGTQVDSGIACEDLCLADLNGDKRLDIVASGRATHNLRIYLNQTPHTQQPARN